MNSTRKILVGALATLGLGLAAAAVSANPSGSEGGMRHGDMKHGEMKHEGMQHGEGKHDGKGHAGKRHDGAHASSLATPEERTAMREKMRNAATPEERQKIAEANHAEMQKRAKEKGITLPEARGPHGRHGKHAAPAAPAAEQPKN